MIFLAHQNKILTYEDLLKNINCGNNSDFFSSLVADLVSNRDVDLTDYKNNTLKNNIKNLEELGEKVLASTSIIKMKTTGTTGKPKTIEHPVLKLLEGTRKSDKKSVWLFTYNKFHMGGIQVALQALVNNDTIVNVYKEAKDCIFEMIEKFNVTNISATPTFYKMLTPSKHKFLNVSRISSGGERLDKETLNIIKDLFPSAKINNIYATTEHGAVLFSKGEEYTLNDKVKIKNKTLWVKNPDDSFSDTGDLVNMTGEKTFVFAGRNTDIINLQGRNVNPNQIEDVLVSHSKVLQALVYTKKSSLMGEVLCCNLVVSDDSLKKEEIKDYMNNTIKEKYKVPRIIKFVDSIETNHNNKVVR